MKITRIIHGETIEITLTQVELIRAFEEQQQLNDVSAVTYHIESTYDGINPAVYEKLCSDEIIGEIAEESRDHADFNDTDFFAEVKRITEDYANDIAADLGLPDIYGDE